MKNRLSFLFATILALLLPLAATAAGTYAPDTICSGITIAGSSATNIVKRLDIRKNLDTGIQFSFQGDAAGTSNVVVYLTPSLDGSKWDSANTISMTRAANGTTEVVGATNIAQSVWAGFGWVKVVATNSAPSGNVTNFVLKASIKY